MKLALITLASVATAQAKHSAVDCAVDGVSAVDSLTGAAVNIWAATARCDKNNAAASQLRCEIDVAAAAQSVADMSNVIVHAAKECGAVDSSSACGIEVGHLLAETSGLAASIGSIVDSCPGPHNPAGKNGDINQLGFTSLGRCIIDATSALKGIFNVMQGVSHLKGHEHKEAMAASVLTDFGSYLANAVDDCSGYKGHGNAEAECAGAVLHMISSLDRIGAIGDVMSHKCKASASRLYLEEPAPKAASASPVSVALACFLPIAAIFGFVVGKRFGKARAEEARLVEVPEEMIE